VVQLLKLPAEVGEARHVSVDGGHDRVARLLARCAQLQAQTCPDLPLVTVTPAVARADPSEGSENGPSATAHRTAHLAVPTAGPLGDDESDDEFWREVSMPIDLDVAPSTCDGGSTTASAGDSHLLHASAMPASDASGAWPRSPRLPSTAAPRARPTHRLGQLVLLMAPPSAVDEAETESSAVAPPAAAWEPLGRRIAP